MIGTQEQKYLYRFSKAQLFFESVGNQEKLEMLAIPGGIFQMGSPEIEMGRDEHESPRHLVKVAPFFMSKYPITQLQWRLVAALPQINRPLDPEPSDFLGDNRPVERVCWNDAVEFCARLAKQTGRNYRLPSEAEWEYACRAGTTTPFHFGETIVTELANYNGRFTYGSAPKIILSPETASFETFANGNDSGRGDKDDSGGKDKDDSGSKPNNPSQNHTGENISSFLQKHQGEYRKQTTPVGIFQVTNAFGLCDLHGNVREWCADQWHDNYEQAPSDGSVWLSNDENPFRVTRGGSWSDYSELCRAASRAKSGLYDISYYIGFRVVFT
ncbi:formylglycine-generating enzyme family protein [Nostoc sp.]|uniref:formylglycine-generating enzyme family protein n=1 Tax=Nostoc sp. TaxID=1180 RepID=UPI002FFA43D2